MKKSDKRRLTAVEAAAERRKFNAATRERLSVDELVTRFGCGAFFGAAIGIGLAMIYTSGTTRLVIGVMVVTAVVCGCCAMKWGDAFAQAVTGLSPL